MKTINIHQAKTELSAVIVKVETEGESFTICRNGKPVADLVPHRPKNRLKTHPDLKKVKVKGDLLEPISESDWDLS